MALSNRPSPGKLTPPLNLELSSQFHPTHEQRTPSAGEKEAKTLDFLSLCSSNDKYNNNSSQGSTVKEKDKTILQMEPRPPPISSMTTQDLFHLTEKGNPISKVVPPHHGLVPRAVPSSYPGNNYALVNGMLGLPPNVTFHMEGSEKSSGSKEHLENLVYWPAVQLKAGVPDLRHNSHLKPLPTLNNQWQQVDPDYVDTGKKSTTQVQSEEEDDDEEEFSHQNSDHNKELTLHKSDPPQKLDGKFHDAKGSTPRSKHSATEQRRRSKINNRFQMLRQLVPNHDQKRDKASFLLEVIEYIQLLQQKAIKYERSNQRQEPQRESELTLLQECGKEGMSSVSTSVPIDSKNTTSLLRSRTNSATPPSNHEVGQASLCQDQSSHSSLQRIPYAFTNPTPMPYSRPLSPHIALFGRNAPPYSTMLAVSEPNTAPTNFNAESTSAPEMNDGANMWREEAHRGPLESGSEEPHFSQHYAISNEKQVGRPLGASATTRHMPNGKQGYMNGCSKVESQHKGDSKLNDQETMTIHGGLINVSSPYSEGLLNALAHALQISGLDLSKASISVQIDMGEGGISIASSSIKEPSGHPRKFRAPPELANDHLAKKTKIELEG